MPDPKHPDTKQQDERKQQGSHESGSQSGPKRTREAARKTRVISPMTPTVRVTRPRRAGARIPNPKQSSSIKHRRPEWPPIFRSTLGPRPLG
jgi:hypothetical protein